MYDSPTSVEEAAQILDKDRSWWYKLCTKPIHQAGMSSCVLAQTYGTFSKGLHRLFDRTKFCDPRFDIFTNEFFNKEWQDEVNKRCSKH